MGSPDIKPVLPGHQTKARAGRRRASSSPKLTIKQQRPWSTRVVPVLLAAVFGAGLMWGYDALRDSGRLSAADAGLPAAVREELDTLTAERDRLSSVANAAESQLNMEKAAQKQLAAQIKSLEAENVRLKEDLAFFESLLPNAAGPQGVAIRRLKVDQIAPNQLRYRLLVMQGGATSQLFSGNLQLLVSTVQEGRNAMMTFPDRSPAEQQKYALNFRHYQRVEGVVTLPDGVVARSVQARVLEKGQLRAQLSANL